MDITTEIIGGRASVHLVGRFDLKTNLDFRNATKPLLAATDVDTLVVDFAQVGFADSSALGLLLLLREQALVAGKKVILANCGNALQKTLAIAQFNRLFTIE